jgi:DNA polymerase III subunit epsilon
MDFLTIDFETANEKRYSACSLGMVIVEKGRITDIRHWLIKPPEMRFNSFNMALHGITPEDVCDKPEFNALWFEIKDYFKGRLVFAHNAGFDIYVLRDLLDYYNISYPDIRYSCTVNLSRKVWNLNNYKLKTVANYLNCEFNHHIASEDAKVCAEIVLNSCKETDSANIEELFEKLGISKNHFPEKYEEPCNNYSY